MLRISRANADQVHGLLGPSSGMGSAHETAADNSNFHALNSLSQKLDYFDYFTAPEVNPRMSCRENRIYKMMPGTADKDNEANTAFQSFTYCPKKICAPKVTVLCCSDGARIRGNHK